MKQIFFTLKLLILSTTIASSQVGIGTVNPTEELDVEGDLRVRNLSNEDNQTASVSALPDGTLATVYSNPAVSGTRLIAFLTSDIDLLNSGFFDIEPQLKLVDVLSEYNTTTGRYVPISDGLYRIGMDFDIGGYIDETEDIDILIGLWNYTNNEWVIRRTFKHRTINHSLIPLERSQSYGITNYIEMAAGNSYGFRIVPTYGSGVSPTAKLKYLNSGTTGSSMSTQFSIEKVF